MFNYIAQGEGGTKLVDIGYVFADTPGSNWTDRLVLETGNGLPRIDDVLYGAQKYLLGLPKALVGVFEN